MIKISKWSDNFETSKSRKLERCDYFHAPARCDSSGYIELMSLGDRGVIAFGIFQGMCQAMAGMRRKVRESGTFQKATGEMMSAAHIATLCHVSATLFESAIIELERVGWIEIFASATCPPRSDQSSATCPPPREGKGSKGKGREDVSISDKLKSHPEKSGGGSVSEMFEEFWDKVPHKIGKAAAQKAFAKAIKETEPAVILGGLLDHEAHRLQQANPPSPIHPATFIRNARWEDEYGAPSSNGNGSRHPEQMTDAEQRKRDKERLYNNPKNRIPPMPKQFIEYMADLKDFQGNPVELNEHQVKAKWNEKTWRESFRKETKHYGN